MLDNLLKLRVTLRTQTNDEIFGQLILEIDNLVYVENCKELFEKIKRLSYDDDSQRYKGKIAACEMKLNEGIKLCTALYDSLSKYEKTIISNKSEFNLFTITTILKNIDIPEVDTPIEEYSEFVYSSTYCKRIKAVLTEAYSLIDQNFSKCVSSISFSYAESSEYKKKYSNVAKILTACGKKAYANILKDKVSKVLQEVELQQKYAMTFTEAQRFISTVTTSIESCDFRKLDEIYNDLMGWFDTLKNASDMNIDVKNDYVEKFESLKTKITKRKEKLDAHIKNVMSEILKPTISVISLQQSINEAINLYPEESVVTKLKESLNLLKEFQQMNVNKPSTIDKHFIDEHESEYQDKWRDTVCDRYYCEWINSLKSEMIIKRQRWMKTNIESINNSLDTMTITQCIQWQSAGYCQYFFANLFLCK